MPDANTTGAVTTALPRPHIMLFIFDDLGWADVGFHDSNLLTPHLNALVASGLRLGRFYTSPECTPTRASVLTGRWAFRVGLQYFSTLVPGSSQGLPPSRSQSADGVTTSTAAELLSSVGYSCHAIGKWHVGYASVSQHLPWRRGFETFVGYLQGMTDYYNRTFASCTGNDPESPTCAYPGNSADQGWPELQGAPGVPALDFWQQIADVDGTNSPPTADSSELGTHTSVTYTQRFADIVDDTVADEDRKKPLFVMYALQLPHIPLESPDWLDPLIKEKCAAVVRQETANDGVIEKRMVLCEMVAAMDAEVGQATGTLKRTGLWENTLVWAFSDNGGMVNAGAPGGCGIEGTSASSNWPLRGGKTTLFEGGVRTVSFVTGGALPCQEGLARSSRSSTSTSTSTSRNWKCGSSLEAPLLFHAADVLPTLCTLAKCSTGSLNASVGAFDGLSAWALFASGGKEGRQDFTSRILPVHVDTNQAVNPQSSNPNRANYSALISWPYKLISGTPTNPALGAAGRLVDGWWTVHPYRRLPPPLEDGGLFGDVMLFNLEEDEAEKIDLSHKNPAKALEMLLDLQRLFAASSTGFVPSRVNRPMPRANPKFHNWTWAPFRS